MTDVGCGMLEGEFLLSVLSIFLSALCGKKKSEVVFSLCELSVILRVHCGEEKQKIRPGVISRPF